MAAIHQILLVGHCGADTGSLRYQLGQWFPQTSVAAVNSQAELAEAASNDSLLLVNRVLDGRFDVGGGVGLIEQLGQGAQAPAMMLISNFPDAQAEAVAAGALPGFGKAELGDKATRDKLDQAIRGGASG